MVLRNEPSVPNGIRLPNISWACSETSTCIRCLMDVPETTKNVTDLMNANQINEDVLRTFSLKSAEMVLVVVHGVHIGGNSILQSFAEEQPPLAHLQRTGSTEVRRIVNLVEVSLRFLHSYIGGSLDTSLTCILGMHTEFLRASYALSTTLKAMIGTHMTNAVGTHGNERGGVGPSVTPTFSRERVSIPELLPTPSIQNRIMQKVVTSMSSVDYDIHNVPLRDESLLPVGDLIRTGATGVDIYLD